MTQDKKVEEIKTKFAKDINLMPIEEALDQALTQYHQDMMSEVVAVLEECDYKVDVDKEPSIQDEAWANQYDSKVEAFWYGERQGLKALTEALTIIKSK